MNAIIILILSITSIPNKTTQITTTGGFKTREACEMAARLEQAMIARATWKQNFNLKVQYVCVPDNETGETYSDTKERYLPD